MPTRGFSPGRRSQAEGRSSSHAAAAPQLPAYLRGVHTLGLHEGGFGLAAGRGEGEGLHGGRGRGQGGRHQPGGGGGRGHREPHGVCLQTARTHRHAAALDTALRPAELSGKGVLPGATEE